MLSTVTVMESNPKPILATQAKKDHLVSDLDSGSSSSDDNKEMDVEEVDSDDGYHYLHFKNSDHFLNKVKIKVTRQPNERKTKFIFLEGRFKRKKGKIWT